MSKSDPPATSGGESTRGIAAIVAAFGVLAFFVRLLPVVRGGGLYGIIDYDDAVYFGSAVAWLHGFVPYRDFLLLHPPGILYVLSPFAALGAVLGDATGFALARLAFMLVGALNTVLVALVAARLGRREAICAAALYAVWDVGAFVERTTWLIAPQNTLLLLALVVLAWPAQGSAPQGLGTRQAALAGALLGLAIAVQIWAAVPFAVVLGWIVVTSRHRPNGPLRPALAFIAAGLLALTIACLPFLIAAGPQMLRYVVADQVGRAAGSVALFTRLRTIEGLPGSGPALRAIPSALVVLAFLVAVGMVAVVAWRRPAIRPWAVLAGAQVGVLLLLPSFFGHYKGWIAPAAALTIGASVATIIGWLERSPGRAFAARAAYGFVLAALILAAVVYRQGARMPGATLDALLANARCVTADSPVLLIETGTLRRDLDAHCPLKLDPSGTSYDTDQRLPPGTARTRKSLPEYQQVVAAYYGGGDAAVFMRLGSGDGFSSETWAAIKARLPVETRMGLITVLTRTVIRGAAP